MNKSKQVPSVEEIFKAKAVMDAQPVPKWVVEKMREMNRKLVDADLARL